MITVVTWLWHDPYGKYNHIYRYSQKDVLALQSMLKKYLTIPHRIVCVTDQPGLFTGTDIRTIEYDWKKTDVARRIFHKVYTFHPEAAEIFGGTRLLMMDLDVLITGNIDDIVSRTEPLVFWRNPTRRPYVRPIISANRAYYNTSIVLMDAGSAPEVWNYYSKEVPKSFRGDQDWVSECVGPDMPHWSHRDGIYRLGRNKDLVAPAVYEGEELPENARIVFFPGGGRTPWREDIQDKYPWVKWHLPEAGATH